MLRKNALGFLSFLTFVLLLSEPCAQGWPRAPNLDYKATYLDTSTGRYYVSMDSGIIADEDSLVAKMIDIAQKRLMDKWNGKTIKVTIFSNQVYAYPKQSLDKKDQKNWAKNYLADYDSEKNEVRIYPALPEKTKRVKTKPLNQFGHPG